MQSKGGYAVFQPIVLVCGLLKVEEKGLRH